MCSSTSGSADDLENSVAAVNENPNKKHKFDINTKVQPVAAVREDYPNFVGTVVENTSAGNFSRINRAVNGSAGTWTAAQSVNPSEIVTLGEKAWERVD